MADAPKYLTISEVAEELRLSAETVRGLCDSGTLKCACVTTGARKHRRIRRDWLDEYERGTEIQAGRIPVPQRGGRQKTSFLPNRLGI